MTNQILDRKKNGLSQKELSALKREAMKNDYWKLYNKKKNGVRLYSAEYCIAEVATKYFLSASTVEKIVNNWIK